MRVSCRDFYFYVATQGHFLPGSSSSRREGWGGKGRRGDLVTLHNLPCAIVTLVIASRSCHGKLW